MTSRYAKQSMYKTALWQRLRNAQLEEQPLCEMCLDIEIITSARVVDHKVRHNGNMQLFKDEDNLQSLCKPCHDSHKQSQERTGALRGGDMTGQPLDINHHWNKGGGGLKTIS